MLVPISTYNSSDNFKNFRETFVEEVATNFELLDKKFSTYNVDDMLQKRIYQTNSCAYLFYNYAGDNVDFIAGLDTSKVTDMGRMFASCSNLTTVPSLDTSKVIDINRMFAGCSNLTTVPQLDTSNATNMANMFDSCGNLTTIPHIDTSKVTNMEYMFRNCRSLTEVPAFDTSKVTNMNEMFSDCDSLTTIPAFDTSKVTNMSYMFYSCGNLTTIPHIDTSKVTNMGNMFYYCVNIEQIHLSNISTNLDIHYCTKMEREALLEVLGNLKDLTGATSKKLTLGSTLLNKLTDDDKAIATNKNWTLA